ncbi:unnamed protein product [Pleuronectes platessa]|uniref:Uncharacterized protein n=1 Tax=Pleuronectes platessa TaxID=8262 RepID=A0A9N7TUG3_PLEPL|nr:unnamed protein product [Pleuronectes platessa]
MEEEEEEVQEELEEQKVSAGPQEILPPPTDLLLLIWSWRAPPNKHCTTHKKEMDDARSRVGPRGPAAPRAASRRRSGRRVASLKLTLDQRNTPSDIRRSEGHRLSEQQQDPEQEPPPGPVSDPFPSLSLGCSSAFTSHTLRDVKVREAGRGRAETRRMSASEETDGLRPRYGSVLDHVERLTAEEMDEQRQQNMAYEYLCHLEEAKRGSGVKEEVLCETGSDCTPRFLLWWTDTDRHRQTQTDTDTDRHRQTQTDTDRHRQTQTDTDRHRHRQTQTDTDTDTDRHRQTQTQTDTDRHRHRQTQTDTDIDRHRHRLLQFMSSSRRVCPPADESVLQQTCLSSSRRVCPPADLSVLQQTSLPALPETLSELWRQSPGALYPSVFV